MIHVVRYTLIAIAIALYLPWQIWMWIGGEMDKRGQRRTTQMMKGDGESLP